MSCQRSVWPLALAPPDGLKCKSSSHHKPQKCSGPALLPAQLQQWVIGGFQTPLQTAGSSHFFHPSLFPTANLQLNATKNTVNTLLAVFHTSPSGSLLLLPFGGERSGLVPWASGWVESCPWGCLRCGSHWVLPQIPVQHNAADANWHPCRWSL